MTTPDLTTTTDELLLACQRARDDIRAKFWIARLEVSHWDLKPYPKENRAE